MPNFVGHAGMQQRGPGIPVTGLQARDEALGEFGVAAHSGNLPHGAAGTRLELDARAHDDGAFARQPEVLGGVGGDP